MPDSHLSSMSRGSRSTKAFKRKGLESPFHWKSKNHGHSKLVSAQRSGFESATWLFLVGICVLANRSTWEDVSASEVSSEDENIVETRHETLKNEKKIGKTFGSENKKGNKI